MSATEPDDFDYFGRFDAATERAQQVADKDATGLGKFVSMKDVSLKSFRFYCRAGGLPFHPSKVHWVPDPADGKKKMVVCRQLAKEPCPLCDLVAELAALGNLNDTELARQLEAAFDYLANVEDQDDPGSVKILRVKPTLYKALVGADEKTRQTAIKQRVGDFLDPQNGFIVEVTRYDAMPWYTAQAAIDKRTNSMKMAPAKRELGPKLHDLSKETIVPAWSIVNDLAHCVREGIPFAKTGFGGGGGGGGGRAQMGGRGNQPAIGNRGSPPPQQQQAPAARPRGPSVQNAVDTVVDDSLFDSQ